MENSPQKLLMCISQNYICARRKNALSVLLTFAIFSFHVIFIDFHSPLNFSLCSRLLPVFDFAFALTFFSPYFSP